MILTKVHVCLISDQPIPNLLPLMLEKPAKAVFLVTAEKKAEAERLKKIIQAFGVQITERVIEPYDLGKVTAVCADIVKDHHNVALTLNVTGGTKISALAAFETFYSTGCRIIYVNTGPDELLTLAPQEEKMLLPDILGVREYLAAYGLRIQKGSGNPPPGADTRRTLTKQLAKLLINSENSLQLLNKKTRPFLGKDNRPAPYLHLAPADFPDDTVQVLFPLLQEMHLASAGINNGININRQEDIAFLGGLWLEEFVYFEVKKMKVKDVRINVKVEWDGEGRRPTTNEFDVLFTHRNRLHVISCKAAHLERASGTGSKGRDAIYELDSLADKAGGVYGKSMLISARPLSDFDRSRAERMKIKVVEGRDILQLRPWLIAWIEQ